MKDMLRNFYHNSSLGHFLIYPAKKIYDVYKYYYMGDEAFIKKSFESNFNYKMDFKNPKTINEKIQWLKLNGRTPLHTICADKYAVRDYIKEKIGEEFLIPLAFHTENPGDIIPQNLPDYPFIIKTNHDNSGHFIIEDKSGVDWEKIQEQLRIKLKRNYYYPGREWSYKNIKPCIIVEKLIKEKGVLPSDYKIHCFNGRVGCVQVDVGRKTERHRRSFYDPDWNHLDFAWMYQKGDAVEQPQLFSKMKSIAEFIARDFLYVRVDLYHVNNRIYFGELTFYPGGGFEKFIPPEWDRKLGDMLQLPLKKK